MNMMSQGAENDSDDVCFQQLELKCFRYLNEKKLVGGN